MPDASGSADRRTLVILLGVLSVTTVGCYGQQSSSARDGTTRSNPDINVEVLNATSITVRWAQPARSSTGAPCPSKKYTIRLKKSGIQQPKAWRLEGDRQSVSLHDLAAATEYQIRLTTVTCEGRRKHSRWVKVRTNDISLAADSTKEETQIPGQPTAVQTRMSSDSAVVSWLPPDDSILVRNYMVGYGEGVPDVKWIYVNGSQRNVTIHNLKPSTQYVFSVRAINRFGKGLVVYDIVYTRETSAARMSDGLPAPVQLRTKVMSPQTVWLQWVDPSLDSSQRITDERYYNVYYHAAASGKNLSVIVKALHVTLHDLIPDRQYRFKVRTVKGLATSPFSETVTNRTLPEPGSVRTTSDDNASYPIDLGDYDYGEDHDDVVPSSRPGLSGDQGKQKRDHRIPGRPSIPQPPHQSLARTLDDPVNATSGQSGIHVAFRSLVQHRVSAYVTWPERVRGAGCGPSAGSTVAGYVFRYRALAGDDASSAAAQPVAATEYVVRNLATNFVLLDNLVPGVRYRYQVRYVQEKGDSSTWSQEAELDTTTNPR